MKKIFQAGFPEQNEVINTAIGKVRSRLVVDCAMPHHQGIYTCSGTSGVKTKISSPITVLIEGKMNFLKWKIFVLSAS